MNTHFDFWNKVLSDGSIEDGSDDLVQKGEASWTKGRQDIVTAYISIDHHILEVKNIVEPDCILQWEQFDNCIFNSVTGQSIRYAREIRCPISFKTKLLITKNNIGTEQHIRFYLNNRIGINVPRSKTTLICRIFRDGKVVHSWR